MTKTITQKIRAKVLWDAGFRSASSMWRFGKIPKRSAERYINEFREGGDHNRKPYSPRTQPQKAPHKIRKVITKAQNRRRIYSLRQIGASSGLSHETTRSILKKRKFKYARFQKRIIIDDDTRQSRLNFARKMLQKESDIPFIIFSDECSFWLNHCRSSRVWTQDPMEEEGTQPHGPKVHVWGQ